MSDKEYTITDMLAATKMSSPTEFQAAFDDVFVKKVADAIAGRRAEVAQNYFNTEAEEQDSEQQSDEQEEDPNENVEASVGSEG